MSRNRPRTAVYTVPDLQVSGSYPDGTRTWLVEIQNFSPRRPASNSSYEIAQNSSQYSRALFFDREIKRVTEIAWDQTVNDTTNFWQSTFWHALGPERAWQLYGIPEPVKEIANGSLC